MNRKFFELLLISGLIVAVLAGCSKPKRRTYDDPFEEEKVSIYYYEPMDGKYSADKDRSSASVARARESKPKAEEKSAPVSPFAPKPAKKTVAKKSAKTEVAMAEPKKAAPAPSPFAPKPPAAKPVAKKAAGKLSKQDREVLDAMKEVASAVDKKDRNKYLSRVYYSPEQKKAVIASFGALVEMDKFTTAMKKEYGEDSLTLKKGNSTMNINSMPSVEELEKTASIQRNGNTAMVSVTGTNVMPQKMRLDGGKWKLDVLELGQGMSPKQVLMMMKTMENAARSCTKMVGKKGMTAEKIHEAFGQRMMMALMTMAGPEMMKANVKPSKSRSSKSKKKMPAGMKIDGKTMKKLQSAVMKASPKDQAKIMKLGQKYKTGKLSAKDQKELMALVNKYGK